MDSNRVKAFTCIIKIKLFLECKANYRIMGYFCGFVSKTLGLIFADFNVHGRQRPRKIISILFRENHRVGGTTPISLDRSTMRKENLRPKYLKRKGIKDTCILTDKQAKRTYLHSDG